jgi:hypothetical protein
MNSRDVVRNSITMADTVVNSYLGDLSDSDITIAPMEGMNPIAWQLGHLIGSERFMVELISPGSCPPLPGDFEHGHGRQVPADASHYYPLAKYKELWAAQRAATTAVLDKLSDADLSRTDEAFPNYAPSVGAIMNMCGLHPMMHVGQWVAVRRKLNKPVVI